MRKRMISLLLTLVLLMSAVSVMPMSAAAATYSVANAISYAQAHWNDGVGLCSEFVSRCVMAGGVNTGVKPRVRDLWPKICSITGLSMQPLKLDSKGYATYALNSGILAKGDVVVQWCSTHNIGPHVLLCGGYDANGYATYYAHNGAMNNKKYKLSVNLAYEHTENCDMGGQVIRLSTLDSNAGANVPAAKAKFLEVSDPEYVARVALSDTNATVVKEVNKLSGVSVTQMGIYLYNEDGTLIKRHIENISNVPATQTRYHSWYDINKELGVTLTSGTYYKYKLFGIFDGQEIVSDMYSFKTTGPTPVKTVSIQFAVNLDGTDKWNGSVTVGQPIGNFPSPAVPSGYKFVGWYTAQNGGVKVDENTPYDGVTKIFYARFEKEEQMIPEYITVYFDANGGNCSKSKVKVTPGDTIASLPIPTRAGYDFVGWYSDEELGSKKVGTNTKLNVTYDITLYAKWEEAEFDQMGEDYIFPFDDVKTSDWYHNDVENAHRMGLINGKSNNRYGANENMTYAEAIKLAACMHQLYETGEITLTNGSGTWYQPYVDYAADNGIPWNCKNYNAQISRRDYVYIFYYALPESDYEEINDIDSIPDVKHGDKYSDEIYAFYRAGILSGSDSKGTFNPRSTIKRSEVAAILSRMMDRSARKEF